MSAEQTDGNMPENETAHHLRMGMRMVGVLWKEGKMKGFSPEMREQILALLEKDHSLLTEFITGTHLRRGVSEK